MKITRSQIALVLAAVVLVSGPAASFGTTKDELIMLNDQITQKKTQVETLGKQIKSYQDKIDVLASQELSLSNEIAILDNQLAKTELDIQSTQAQIEQIGLELRELDTEISATNDRLANDKTILGDLIRKIDREDERTGLEALFLADNISALFNRAKYLEDLQGDMLKTIQAVADAKTKLEATQAERVAKDVELKSTKDELAIQKIKLQDARESKSYLVDATRNSEYKFRNFVAGLQDEAALVSSDLAELQAKAQSKLRSIDMFPSGNVVLSWPVPSRRVTMGFHDADYPFRRIMEHSGIDIGSTPQGTSVTAAAPGYVLKAKNAGYGYSYVIIMHGDGIATVYGHLSKINVIADSYVNRGDVIGRSGGMPGTPGAGSMTTGPHLHFEVRANGIPVNALDYLVD